ncbi:hypothetical protein J4E81_010881 [Alternaria sp. BMP 2799]|uniref:uncharacterized protein n=1 Tax=Alternaria infectoria TaxID=45303 RepID=UPI0022206885|nr:uncharacterized protein J4E92_009433 [Alternaria infectoria]KAI4677602.1 hypothetical protein J4E81_010881 [Alternaria sp. BMP 2799]KAI4915157.1 hypothetical protein J4E92_009433 [Alternaria infectoria]
MSYLSSTTFPAVSTTDWAESSGMTPDGDHPFWRMLLTVQANDYFPEPIAEEEEEQEQEEQEEAAVASAVQENSIIEPTGEPARVVPRKRKAKPAPAKGKAKKAKKTKKKTEKNKKKSKVDDDDDDDNEEEEDDDDDKENAPPMRRSGRATKAIDYREVLPEF